MRTPSKPPSPWGHFAFGVWLGKRLWWRNPRVLSVLLAKATCVPSRSKEGSPAPGDKEVPVLGTALGGSPAEHEDVVEQGVVGQGHHLLQAQLLAAPVEAIGAVDADVAVVAARAVLHGAQSRWALVEGKAREMRRAQPAKKWLLG